MTEDILYPFHNLSQHGIYKYREYVKVIDDFIKRTNNFSASNDRNSFLLDYRSKLISNKSIGSNIQNQYKVTDYITCHYERESGTHLIEKLLLVVPNEGRTAEGLFNSLKSSSLYTCTDIQNKVFISVMHKPRNPEFKLESQSTVDKTSKNVLFTSLSKFAPNNKYLGIGQIKVGIQEISPSKVGIGITLSNVFKNVITARDMIAQSFHGIYTNAGLDVRVSHALDSIIISFSDSDIIRDSDNFHKILNHKVSSFDVLSGTQSYYGDEETVLANKWKQSITSQLYADCKEIDQRLITQCIEVGIKSISYKIGSNIICNVLI